MTDISKFKVCTRCVMDTTDPDITFNKRGECNHCQEFDHEISREWFPNEEGAKKLDNIFTKIRNEGKNKPYDCIIGLSGGADSSYLALKLKEANLRPLVVHVDGGWNSELAVHNIERIIKYCGFELHTEVINWDEMRDLQLAFLRSGVSNQDIPQDHAFFSTLYKYATKNKINYFITGSNIATESVSLESWHEVSAMDSTHIKAIHKKFGNLKLKTFPLLGFFEYYLKYRILGKLQIVRPLNYMIYDKAMAIAELQKKIGWKSYDRKHGESVFTKFFQNYFLPTRFGYDKRKPHLSSMILSGLITRKEALQDLQKPLYSDEELRMDKEYIMKKLGVSEKELNEFITQPLVSHFDYPNETKKYLFYKKLYYKLFRK